MVSLSKVTATTTPAQLVVASGRTKVRIVTTSASILYIGADNSVSSSNGWLLDTTLEGFSIELSDGDEIWAVTSSGSASLSLAVSN